MTPLALEWVQKAEEDFEVAKWIEKGPTTAFNAICFHCQQCIEKYLKARLSEAGVAFAKTHDLDVLLNLALPIEPAWAALRPQFISLKPFSVETRYPGVSASATEATDALRTCTELRKAIRQSLGL